GDDPRWRARRSRLRTGRRHDGSPAGARSSFDLPPVPRSVLGARDEPRIAGLVVPRVVLAREMPMRTPRLDGVLQEVCEGPPPLADGHADRPVLLPVLVVRIRAPLDHVVPGPVDRMLRSAGSLPMRRRSPRRRLRLRLGLRRELRSKLVELRQNLIDSRLLPLDPVGSAIMSLELGQGFTMSPSLGLEEVDVGSEQIDVHRPRLRLRGLELLEVELVEVVDAHGRKHLQMVSLEDVAIIVSFHVIRLAEKW